MKPFIFCDISRRLLCCHFHISFPNLEKQEHTLNEALSIEEVKLILKKDRLLWMNKQKKVMLSFLFKHFDGSVFEVDPESISNLHASCNSVSYRVRLPESIKAFDEKSSACDPKNCLPSKIQLDSHLECVNCSATLLYCSEFQRVIELPSDDVSEWVDNWCCHQHGQCSIGASGQQSELSENMSASVQRGSFVVDFLYYNLYKIFLNAEIVTKKLKRLNIEVDDSGSGSGKELEEQQLVLCRRCKFNLGLIRRSPGGLRHLELLRVSLSCREHDDISLSSNFADLLLCVAGQHFQLCSRRIIVEFYDLGSRKMRPVLLLWLIEKQAMLSRVSITDQLEELAAADTELRMQRAIKLTVQLCGSLHSAASGGLVWDSRDMSVEHIELTKEMIRRLQQTLLENSRFFPKCANSNSTNFLSFLMMA